jgi:hypothetical protein
MRRGGLEQPLFFVFTLEPLVSPWLRFQADFERIS